MKLKISTNEAEIVKEVHTLEEFIELVKSVGGNVSLLIGPTNFDIDDPDDIWLYADKALY